MKILLNHWSCLQRDPFLLPSLPITVINLSLLVAVIVLLVGVVAVEMVVFNATALFAIRFVVRKVIMLFFFMTATLIPQNLPTLWSLLLRPLIDIRIPALLHT